MSFKTFEEIEAWQAARLLTRKIRIFAHRAIAKHDWAWADQISRSALSIMANIAEGNDARTNTEFITFLSYAKRSGTETRSHLYYGLDEGYVLPEEHDECAHLCRRITAQIAMLMQYLQQHKNWKERNIRISKSSNPQPGTSNPNHTGANFPSIKNTSVNSTLRADAIL